MKFLITVITVLLSLNVCYAFDHSHQKWSDVLSKYVVKNGPTSKVKYSQLIQNPQELKGYLTEVSAVTKDEYNKFSENQKLSFLFNAYNAYTVQLIVDEMKKNPELKSVKNIGSLFKSTWKIKFFNFLGENSNLDRIEHDLTRPNFDEPRLHVAFNCASIGCPALQKEAFTANKLNEQLDKATREFLNDKSRNIYHEKSKELKLSSIFKWYRDDFEKSKKFKSLRNFIVEHMSLTDEIKNEILAEKVEINFLDYDWNLNKI